MSQLELIAAFWLVVFAVLWWLHRNRESTLARVAFSWNGPYPAIGERKSSYYRRKTFFALGWMAQIVTIAAILALAGWLVPAVRTAETFILVSMFALSIGAGMALLGALLTFAVSLKAKLLGPDPVFQQPGIAAGDREA